MNNTILSIALAAVLALAGGCKQLPSQEGEKPKVEVSLSGRMNGISRAVVHPQSDRPYPETQLPIGVAMMVYNTPDPAVTQPSATDWGNALLAWRRGYFGGPGLGAPGGVTNGEIRFTSADGSAVQNIFYEETGMSYFLRAVYPWSAAVAGASITGGDLPMAIDGSQDVMCSNIGWGNMNASQVQPLTFRHLLTKLNIFMVAEADRAIAEYGQILSVELINQPEMILLDLYSEELYQGQTLRRYPMVGDITPSLLSTTPVNFGYVMAMPSTKFTIRIRTEHRLAFYVDIDVDFPESSEAGAAYDVTLQFMQSDEIVIKAEKAKKWFLDWEFN